MADSAKQIQQLPSLGLGLAANNDLLIIEDLNAPNGSANSTTKNISVANLFALIPNTSVGANVNITTLGISIGNSTVNLSANSTILQLSNSTSNAVITPLTFSFGNSTANNVGNSIADIIQSNSTVNSNYSATLIQVANSTSTANMTAAGFVVGGSIINTTAFSEGANVFITTAGFSIGNSTVNTTANSSVVNTGIINLVTGANVGANVNLTTSGFQIGNSTANLFANSSTLQISNSTSNAVITTLTFSFGNSTVNAIGNSIAEVIQSNTTVNSNFSATLIQVANSTSIANVTAAGFVVGTSTINTTAISEGANVILNTTSLLLGNTTVNAVANTGGYWVNGVKATGGGGLFSTPLAGATVPTSAGTGLTTWLSQGVAAVQDSTNGILLSAAENAGDEHWHLRTMASPGTPYTITALFAFTPPTTGNVCEVGIGWTDNTKLQLLRILVNSAAAVSAGVAHYSNTTTFVGNDSTNSGALVPNVVWVQIHDDGTNVSFLISSDGVDFIPLFSIAKSSGYLGASGYTNVCIGVASNSSSTNKTTQLKVLYWVKTNV
jgi:hypothetical protein